MERYTLDVNDAYVRITGIPQEEIVGRHMKELIDEYVAIIRQIAHEAFTEPDLVLNAPHNSTISVIDHEPLVNIEKFACTWRAFKKKTGQQE